MAGGQAAMLPNGKESSFRGRFGEIWVQALCNAAGCRTAEFDVDDRGVDVIVHDHHHEMARLQVKTTENPPAIKNGRMSFSLDVPTYDRLREGGTLAHLIVVVVHAPHPHWTHHYLGCMSLVRATAYWTPLLGRPATTNTSTVALTVPSTNMLTPATVLDLFDDQAPLP